MIPAVFADTQQSNTDTIIIKLNAAQDWVWNRVLPMNTEILKVTNDQNTVAAATKSYNLNANVTTGTLYDLQWMGVQFSGETEFTAVSYVNGSDPNFIYWDQQDEQAVHPQMVVIDNFNQVRFAPGLPASTIIRADYIYKPRTLSLPTQTTCDLPEVFHECVVAKACSYVWTGIDDTRSQTKDYEALDRLYGAQNVLAVRQFQQPFRTRPSSRGVRRRWMMT